MQSPKNEYQSLELGISYLRRRKSAASIRILTHAKNHEMNGCVDWQEYNKIYQTYTLLHYFFALEDASILHQTYFIIALHLLPILADIQ